MTSPRRFYAAGGMDPDPDGNWMLVRDCAERQADTSATVHVNDGSAHQRAMAWSEGYTAGFEEAHDYVPGSGGLRAGLAAGATERPLDTPSTEALTPHDHNPETCADCRSLADYFFAGGTRAEQAAQRYVPSERAVRQEAADTSGHGPCDYNGGPGSDQCPHGVFHPDSRSPRLREALDALSKREDVPTYVEVCALTIRDWLDSLEGDDD
jgi:hypothetical protein